LIRRASFTIGLFFVAISLCAATARANPVDTFGFGSRSTSLAGANVADVDDVSANYYNPAGLVAAKGLRFDIGYVHVAHRLQMNGADNGVDPVRAMTFGIVAPGKVANIPFAFGVGMHLPDDRVFRVRSLQQEQPRWEMYDNRTQRLLFSANLAIRPFEWLEIGGGLSFLAQTRARLDITGRVDIATPETSELRHEVDADLTSIRYPQFGIIVHPTKTLRLGATYRGKFELDLDINARVNVLANYLGTIQVPFLAEITTHTVDNYQPQQVVIGGSWDATPAITLDADVTWVNWGAYLSPATKVTTNLKIDVPPGFPSTLLPDNPAPTLLVDPKFHDTFVPRVGGEWRLPLTGRGFDGHVFAVRAGYYYERSPIPEQTGITNFVDTDHHTFTGGMGIKLIDLVPEIGDDELHFDVHAAYSYLPARTMHKSDGWNLIGDYTARGSIWLVGATVGLVFL
jgi:long-chain fatty acid transport protein